MNLMRFKEICNFFKHPFKNLLKVGDYDNLSKQYTDLLKEIGGAIKYDHEIIESNRFLIQRANGFEKHAKSLSEEIAGFWDEKKEFAGKVQKYNELKSQYDGLKSQYGELVQEIPRIRKLVAQARETCIDVHIKRDLMHDGVEENLGRNKSLEDWINCEKAPLEKKVKAAEKEADSLRGYAFSAAVYGIINGDSSARKIPVAYYDFVNQRFEYNNSALRFLDIKKKERKTKLSIRELLENIDGIKEKKEIIKSLKTGKGLKHLKAKTTKGKELILTSHPFYYDNKAVGVGMFLYDPRFFGHKIKMHKLADEIEEVLEIISEEFNQIHKTIENDRITYKL